MLGIAGLIAFEVEPRQIKARVAGIWMSGDCLLVDFPRLLRIARILKGHTKTVEYALIARKQSESVPELGNCVLIFALER